MKKLQHLYYYYYPFLLKLTKSSPSYYNYESSNYDKNYPANYYAEYDPNSQAYSNQDYNQPGGGTGEDYEFFDYGHPQFSIELDNMAIGEGSQDPLMDQKCEYPKTCQSGSNYLKSLVNDQKTENLEFINDCSCCMQISYSEQTKFVIYGEQTYYYIVLNNPHGSAGYRINCIPENFVAGIPKGNNVSGFLILNTEISEIPEDLFVGAENYEIAQYFQIISIKQNNYLRELNVKFHDLTHLYGLYIEENKKLKHLGANMFKNLPEIQELRITKSSLEYIPSDIFEEMPKLKWVYLNGNKIKTIGVESFRHIQRPMTEFIDFSDNDMIELDCEIFEGMTNLVDLKFNGMRSLSTVQGSHLPRLENLKNLEFTETGLKKDTLPKMFFSKLTHKVTVFWDGIDTWTSTYRKGWIFEQILCDFLQLENFFTIFELFQRRMQFSTSQ